MRRVDRRVDPGHINDDNDDCLIGVALFIPSGKLT